MSRYDWARVSLWVLWGAAPLLGGCSSRMATRTDAAEPDAAASDAGRDATVTLDSGRDAGGLDAGPDTGAARDVGPGATHDVGLDATLDAASSLGRTLECVPAASGSTAMSAMVFSPSFWVGFRFHITSATALTSVGLSLRPDPGASGSVLAGIVTLTDGFDPPNSPDLTSSDVLATTLVTVAASSTPITVSAPLSTALPVGWYALVFGLGSGGATLSGASVYSQSGGGGCTLPESSYPFSIRQSDGMLILQGVTPHFFVTVEP